MRLNIGSAVLGGTAAVVGAAVLLATPPGWVVAAGAAAGVASVGLGVGPDTGASCAQAVILSVASAALTGGSTFRLARHVFIFSAGVFAIAGIASAREC